MFRNHLIFASVVLLCSCQTTKEFTGYSYDPPGVTDTRGKEVTPQKRRVIGAGHPRVWLSNEFEGARANDFYQIGPNTFEVLIEAENYPINNSPWFAFSIWSDTLQAITLKLRYTDARHRYLPKVYIEKGLMNYSHIISDIRYDSTDGTASFGIYVDQTPSRVSAHLLEGTRYSDLEARLNRLPAQLAEVTTIGHSLEGRNIYQVTIDQTRSSQEKGVLVLFSRQHPPEITGYHTFWAFFDALMADTELAQTFRRHFVVKAFPMINPDGVVNGHWRHNAAGIDLNRDWAPFNQPETKAIRDALLPLKEAPDYRVYYAIDFHSTNENIFYPILEHIPTTPDNLTQRWIPSIIEQFPQYMFSIEEFDTNSPISKNWIFNTFGADALTFEVDDEMATDQLHELGNFSAQTLMELLINEYKSTNPPNH